MTRRVVITGMGTVNALSSDLTGYWRALLQGRSGISLIEHFDTSDFRVKFAGVVKDFKPETVLDRKSVHRLDRFTQLALVATHHAVKDSGLDFSREDPYRSGCIMGCGIGGLGEFEEQHRRFLHGGSSRVSPFVIPKMIVNSAAGTISIDFGLSGPCTAVATACASAGHAVGDSFDAIRYGKADIMVSGGTEAGITPMGVSGFIAARALSLRNENPAEASRPFDLDRDGFVMAEGAGVLILEEFEHAKRRGANIYAEVLGCGNTADAHHITAPHPCGAGAKKAMEVALREAHCNPDEVQYINAHGTSTELGDAAETQAIKSLFGEHAKKLAVSSTKSMLGHLLGASGGVELIATVMTIKHGVIHPTINYVTPDPACDLDYVPNQPREQRVRRAISNSFGFGGHNCCVAVGALN
jgi:3-oxoacyl-[acyl-carrier-protein] synthase II